MRKIDRFRAFDNRIKIMYPFVILGWNGAIEARLNKDDAGSVKDIRNYHLNGNFEDYDGEIDILQNIGISDKNNDNIYEGDIIEIDKKYYSVNFRETAFYLSEDLHGTHVAYHLFTNWNLVSKIKIVGNIYENSDLLS